LAHRDVLVIGGSGFLGRCITERFVGAGDRVAVLSRGQRRHGVARAEQIVADRRNPAAMRHALGDRRFDVVVDNVAYDREDVRITLDALGGRVGHYLATGSVAVYADRFVRRPIAEHEADLGFRQPVDAPNPFHPRLGHAYGNGKRDAEQAIRTSGIPWTILRPPVILGADDRTLRVWWFVQRLLDGQPIVIVDWGPGRVFQVAWAEDVARAFLLAAGNPAAFGRAYNVAQAEVYTDESWVEAAADTLGATARYVHVAEDDLERVGLLDYALPIAGRPFGHLLLDTCAIRRDLGFEAAPESIWLAETLRGCRASPPAVNSAGYDHRDQEIRVANSLFAWERAG
jgi:nucleoside-diphosphate-sugar epimerase